MVNTVKETLNLQRGIYSGNEKFASGFVKSDALW